MGHVPLPKPPPFPEGYLPLEDRLQQALSVLEKRLERLERSRESVENPSTHGRWYVRLDMRVQPPVWLVFGPGDSRARISFNCDDELAALRFADKQNRQLQGVQYEVQPGESP